MTLGDFPAASEATGYICLLFLSIAFGVAYIPLKRFDMGNGLFAQWIMCVSIAACCLVVHLGVGSSQIFALTILSGCLFSLGNVFAVPIVKRIGLAIGFLLWSIFNLLTGWASSRFGWFGIKPQPPRNQIMNYFGVVLAALSSILYVFINPSLREEIDPPHNQDFDTIESGSTESSEDIIPLLNSENTGNRCGLTLQLWDRLVGIFFAVFSGICYGLIFIPVIYVQENYPTASQRGIDYIGAMGVGVLLTSTAVFIIYASYSKNEPTIPSVTMILPALLAGALWTTGQCLWLVANEALKESITFPIATTAPGAINAMVATLFFREVRGCKNYVILLTALVFTATAAVLTGLSR